MRDIGDIVTTKTGKTRVITGISHACPPEEFDARMQRFEDGKGVKPCSYDRYDTRALRDGKPYGPVRTYSDATLWPEDIGRSRK